MGFPKGVEDALLRQGKNPDDDDEDDDDARRTNRRMLLLVFWGGEASGDDASFFFVVVDEFYKWWITLSHEFHSILDRGHKSLILSSVLEPTPHVRRRMDCVLNYWTQSCVP